MTKTGRRASRVPAPLRPAWHGALRVFRRLWSVRNRDAIVVAADALWPFGPLAAPHRLASVGAGDFAAVGAEFLGHFRSIGQLRPDDRVLDIGAGAGRIALPLSGYLTGGTYDGLEIYRPHVAWCRRRIGRAFPRFRFHHADILSDTYNPRGRLSAATYRFPFGEDAFDFVILTSVLTHLLPNEIDRYLAEVARVMAPAGRCFATFFVVGDDEAAAIAAGRSAIAFVPFGPDALVGDPAYPSAAVAVTRPWLDARLAAHGLACVEFRPGGWSGRRDHTSFQDIVVLARHQAG